MTSSTEHEASIAIREATQPDLLAVFRIEKASFAQPWPFAAFERFLGGSGFLVATDARTGGHADDDRVIGFVIADSVPNHGRTIGHIKDIAVHPDRRGRGVGRTLLARALSVLAAEGVGYVKLEVREANDPARALYREFGFETRRRIPRYYDDGETALVMVRSLDES